MDNSSLNEGQTPTKFSKNPVQLTVDTELANQRLEKLEKEIDEIQEKCKDLDDKNNKMKEKIVALESDAKANKKIDEKEHQLIQINAFNMGLQILLFIAAVAISVLLEKFVL